MSNLAPQGRNFQERIWASGAHASVLTGFSPLCFLPGISVVIFIWFRHRHHNPWIAFHALQALVYQILLTLLFVPPLIFLFLACQPSIGAACAGFDPRLTGRLWLWFFCALPLFVSFSVFGAIRILQGKDFGYPLIARFLRTRLKVT
jgi:uncharacterized Tic20 family protein